MSAEHQEVITLEDLSSINDLDVAFGTTRFLSEWGVVPKDFKDHKNVYVRLADALFFGEELPNAEVIIASHLASQNEDISSMMQRFIMAHLRSWEPKHEHKIAGVAYLISQICQLRED